jgi:CRISPR-associated endonuclease/helicase Cas3
MSDRSPIWAKSVEKDGGAPVRLYEHIQHALAVLDNIKHRVKAPLCELIRLAIVCHDWGKVLPAFQIRTLKNSTYKPDAPLIQMPHSLFSLLWIDETKLREKLQKELQEKDISDYREFLLSAIAYHHWRENFFELISASYREIMDLLDELDRAGRKNDLQKNLQEEIQQLGNNWHELIAFNEEMAKGLRNGVPFMEYARPPYQLYFLPKRAGMDERKLRDWVLIAGFLQRADHFASFCEEEGEDVRTAEAEKCPVCFNDAIDKVKAEIAKKTESQTQAENIWQLDKIYDCKDKNIVLIAPTGYGKTEFAFLWGSNEKLFYTLPLRAAVNQIYQRAKAIFGDGKAGLLHSDADVFLLGDGGEGQANLKAYDLARQLAFPVIISTGDQFFPYALRPPGYEKIYATFSYSRLVIDEVQAYDPRAAAIVVKFIEDIVRMGGKFLLMTATLPELVRTEIENTIGKENFAEINLYDEKRNDFEVIKKHKIKVELLKNRADEEKPDFTIPEEKLVEVLDQACKGKRVLVIANTVKQAQDIFKRLKTLIEEDAQYTPLKNKIWLLHSRFTQADRSKLETEICGDKEKEMQGEFQNPKPHSESEGKILVATQVVEASLDIDVDVLFTEIAPLDALVQRMGRVLRRYGPMTPPNEIPVPCNPNVIVWVFKNDLQSGRGYVYDNELMLLTLKLLKDKSEEQGSDNIKDWITQKKKKAKNEVGKLISLVIEEVFHRSQPLEFIYSEYDKYDVVKKLYGSLPEDSSYLMKFQQTKDILDAGYMSDRKEEAHRLFREIYTISVIPSEKRDEFIKEICQFFEKHHDDKRLYTYFKQEVLAKFVVQVPLNLRQLEGRRLQPVEWWVRDLECKDRDIVKDIQRKRLLRWCRDIYFAGFEYDSNKGILANVPWNHVEASII